MIRMATMGQKEELRGLAVGGKKEERQKVEIEKGEKEVKEEVKEEEIGCDGG